ncbi:MAG: M23 family metallopeptidase [Limnobacter sp.]|uniref:M23 family metallopeptidase n=1 Tax=Limnobacter sp. TaxID=2003368 RepID=UPI00391E041D
MQLILMRGPFGRVATVSISALHLWLALAFFILVLLGSVFGGMMLVAHYGDEIPGVQNVMYERQMERLSQSPESSSPLDAMAIRLAEMRAQLARLDAVSARLLKASGVESKAATVEVLGQGGLRQPDERSLSYGEVKATMKDLAKQIDKQADVLSIIDTDMQLARVRNQGIPNELPLTDTVAVSNFGNRIDPITGRRSLHEGIDFIAPIGTPILAAAAGVVIEASFHPAYGNMVEIEHDNKTVTRYAHASRLLVKKGDIVRNGQNIALVGNTGRSTGPHLHFEVRVEGQAKDPMAFLAKHGQPRPSPGAVAALAGILPDSTAKPIQ